MTLVVVHDDQRILLGLKKRGFGEGRWNGFGGKIESGERIEVAAQRELLEECNLTATTLKPRGMLTFTTEGSTDIVLVHIFVVVDFIGELQESEEMRPEWFDQTNIPYEHMWPDDRYWLPLVLAGKSVKGVFHFSSEGILLRHAVDALTPNS